MVKLKEYCLNVITCFILICLLIVNRLISAVIENIHQTSNENSKQSVDVKSNENNSWDVDVMDISNETLEVKRRQKRYFMDTPPRAVFDVSISAF